MYAWWYWSGHTLKTMHQNIKGRGRGLAPGGQRRRLGFHQGPNVLAGPCSDFLGTEARAASLRQMRKGIHCEGIQLSENITDQMMESSPSGSKSQQYCEWCFCFWWRVEKSSWRHGTRAKETRCLKEARDLELERAADNKQFIQSYPTSVDIKCSLLPLFRAAPFSDLHCKKAGRGEGH